jgi:protein-S-isoprenylcysteine O-methyltransferase Ste14
VTSYALRVGVARAYAVGGAIAFAASLATAIVLDRRLGRGVTPDPFGASDLVALLVNVALFSVFALHHSVMARTGIKARLSRHLAPELERSTYVWAASALFALVCLAWRPMPSLVYEVDAPWAWALTAARLVGVWLTLDAASRIDPRELAGLRQAWSYGVRTPERVADRAPISSTGATGEPETGPLVARGGYRLVRHPIYLGWILMVWGAPTASAGRLTFAVVSTLYLLLAIPFEERSLRERFGESYRHYTHHVRWRVLPGVY